METETSAYAAGRIKCEAHGRAFKAQFQGVLFRCGEGCDETHPEWATRGGWAIGRLTGVSDQCPPACAGLLRPLPGYPPQHADGCTHYHNPGPDPRRQCGCGNHKTCGECMARHHTGWRRWDR